MHLRDIQIELLSQIFSNNDANEVGIEILEPKPGTLSPLDIYRDSIMGGLVHALAETYPVCQRLVGRYFFNAMAEKYALQAPSQQPDLNEYGATFPAFIAGYEPANSVDYLADVARLEWLCNVALLASNNRHNNLANLGELPEREQMNVVFSMPPGCSILASSYPIGRIWNMHQADESDDVGEIEVGASSVKLLVWRPHLQVRLVELEDEQYAFLSQLLQQATLVEACEHCLGQYPGLDMNTLIDHVLQQSWVQGFYLKNVG